MLAYWLIKLLSAILIRLNPRQLQEVATDLMAYE